MVANIFALGEGAPSNVMKDIIDKYPEYNEGEKQLLIELFALIEALYLNHDDVVESEELYEVIFFLLHHKGGFKLFTTVNEQEFKVKYPILYEDIRNENKWLELLDNVMNKEKDECETKLDTKRMLVENVSFQEITEWDDVRSSLDSYKRMERHAPEKKQKSLLKRCEEFLKENEPHVLSKKLEEYVIGQEEAKRTIANIVFYHIKRVINALERKDTENRDQKNNALIIGPPGSGKTELVHVLKHIGLPVPIIDFSANLCSENGYTGLNLPEVIGDKMKNVDDSNYAIVFVDEFDKIIVPSISSAGDDKNKALQAEFLRIIEGVCFEVNHRDTVNTYNQLYVCAGAFPGLLDEGRMVVRGFSQEPLEKNINSEMIEAKLEAYGMLPELLRRLPRITSTKALDAEQMRQILNLKKGILYQIERDIDIKFDITPEAITELIEQSISVSLGVSKMQGHLRKTVEELAYDAMANGEEYFVVDAEDIKRSFEF